MKYYTDFENDTSTATPIGWTARDAAASAPANYTFGTKNGSPAIKRRYLLITNAASASFPVLSWDRVDGDASRATFEIAFATVRQASDTSLCIYARGQGSASVTDFYRVRLNISGNQVLIEKCVAGVLTAVSTLSYTYAAGVDYFGVFQGNGTALQVRLWASGAAEPTTWDISTTDASLSAAGFVGISGTTASPTKTIGINFLSIGTGADGAQRPKTNADYLAWLNQQGVRREVLGEISAWGFSSTQASRTKTVKTYISRAGFISRQWDTPSTRHYREAIVSIPTFTRSMPLPLSGTFNVGFGDLVVDNSSGARDDWLRRKWKKSYVKLFLGDPTWPRHDFRLIVFGLIKDPPSADLNAGTLTFGLADLSEAFNVPIQTATISTAGTYNGAFKPTLIGSVESYVEPPEHDVPNLTFMLNDGALDSAFHDTAFVIDNWLPLLYSQSVAISAVNAATDTLSTAAAHGLLVNWRIRFLGGTPPAPLALNTNYWVVNVPSSTDFKLAATLGGAVIDITSTTTGAQYLGYGYTYDTTNGTVTLVSSPVGRVLSQARQASSSPGRLDTVYDSVIFTRLGLSRDYKDDTAFATFSADAGRAGLWYDTKSHAGPEILKALSEGTLSWYGISPDGLVQIGRIGLPASTAVMTFTEDDVKVGTLLLERTILPLRPANLTVRYSPLFLTNGLPQISSFATYATGAIQVAQPTEPGARTPVDYAFLGDTQPPVTYTLTWMQGGVGSMLGYVSGSTPYVGGSNINLPILQFFLRQIGVFSFVVPKLAASRLSIGDTIQLTHSRLGWKAYTATDPPSVDSPGPFDATKAVVIGIEANVSVSEVKLTVFRQMPGAFQEVEDDSAQLFNAFKASFLGTLVPEFGSATVTLTRSTIRSVLDFEKLLRICQAGELATQGYRRVENLAQTTSADLGNAAWTKTSTTVAGDGKTVTATGANGEVNQAYTKKAGNRDFRIRAKLTRSVGSGNVQLRIDSTFTTVAISTTPTAFSALVTNVSSASVTWGARLVTSGDAVVIEEIQLEDVTGQANQAPSEYVSIGVAAAPYFGAGVDGVRCFPYTNGATVTSNVITDAQGSPHNWATVEPYALKEPQRTNRIQAATAAAVRDFTNAAWTKSASMTAAKTQRGWDGVPNTACSLTAGAANQTVLFALTLTSAQRVFSVGIKRRLGTGNIDLTMDNGATWTTVASAALSSADFILVEVQQTLANPTVGIRIATNGDSITADFNQVEEGAKSTSRIPDTIATRNEDQISFPKGTLIDRARGFAYIEVARLDGAAATLPVLNDSTRTFLEVLSTGAARFSDGTNTVSTLNTPATVSTPKKIAAWWNGALAGISLDGGAEVQGAFDGDYGAANTIQFGDSTSIMGFRNLRFGDTPPTTEQMSELSA